MKFISSQRKHAILKDKVFPNVDQNTATCCTEVSDGAKARHPVVIPLSGDIQQAICPLAQYHWMNMGIQCEVIKGRP